MDSQKNVAFYEAPSGRELSPQATEGERVYGKFSKSVTFRRLLPSRLRRATSLSEGGFDVPNGSGNT